jgi:hypothetical protein
VQSILHPAALHMQVLAGLDDVLMCLAELQLQQEGKGSCASALEKASACMQQLQDSLSVGTSSGQHKLAVEVSMACWSGTSCTRQDTVFLQSGAMPYVACCKAV